MQTEPTKPTEIVELWLYVLNRTHKSVAAYANLKRICDKHLPGRCRIDVIDILERPEVAKRDEVVAIPTVVRRRPSPMRRVIGDLSNVAATLRGLELEATCQGADL